MILLKSDKEIEYMRDAGRIVARTLNELQLAVKPGISTIQLDTIAESYIRKAGAIPAFKGYSGFPASICASINEEVVHGIPGKRKLADGDIISIDVGVAINGYYGDAAVTIPVGNIQDDIQLLLETTEASLLKGIEKAIVGNRLSDISNAVQTFVEERSFSVVRDYVGHGIGKNMHEDPQIPNFGPAGRGPRLEAGMTLAIEPMVNMGTYEVSLMKDKWTVVTKDRKPSAHFEHTVAIGFDGPEVLTTI